MTEIAPSFGGAEPDWSTAKPIGKIIAQQRRQRADVLDAAVTYEIRPCAGNPAEGFVPHVTLVSPHLAHTPVD